MNDLFIERALLDLNNKIGSSYFSILDVVVAESVINDCDSIQSKSQELKQIGILVALCHREMRNGHTYFQVDCLPEPLATILTNWPTLEEWLLILENYPKIHNSQHIIIEDGAIYIKRMHLAESSLANQILRYAHSSVDSANKDHPDHNLSEKIIENCSEEQQCAIRETEKKSMVLLSGGPGTGKTFTVLRCIINILQNNPESKIALVAPTGKAVARLNESMENGISNLQFSFEWLDRIPREAETIHRFLEKTNPSVSATNYPTPGLSLDWLFIDEVSMVDLNLMTRLLTEIPPGTKVFMLGDINQLASVQPGAVFADLYRFVKTIEIDQSSIATIELTKGFRFSNESKINLCCEAIRQGCKADLKALLNQSEKDIQWIQSFDSELIESLEKEITSQFYSAATEENPNTAINLYRKWMFLSPLNKGLFGVESLNKRIFERLIRFCHTKGHSYIWLPILITKNDYTSGLYNGDIGIQKYSIKERTSEFSFFDKTDSFLSIPASQLPAHDMAFALTIHKSQGSEAQNVVLILPETNSPIMTRELLYTAVSRARESLRIIASWESLEHAITNPTVRNSGLLKRLHSTLVE